MGKMVWARGDEKLVALEAMTGRNEALVSKSHAERCCVRNGEKDKKGGQRGKATPAGRGGSTKEGAGGGLLPPLVPRECSQPAAPTAAAKG